MKQKETKWATRSLVASLAIIAALATIGAWAADTAVAEIAKSKPAGPGRDYFADPAEF